ncbi:hypothetical protein L7F22_011237 [Adiantum nelumboides]|nr:hypothetical protein [Adiantum nelumboides]
MAISGTGWNGDGLAGTGRIVVDQDTRRQDKDGVPDHARLSKFLSKVHFKLPFQPPYPIAYALMGLSDTIIVNRWNLRVGIPDHAFVIGDETLTDVIWRLQLIPFLVLSARLCPPGVEGTVFAFLMSVSNFGATCASWNGAFLLHQLNVRREDYSSLWLAVVIRSLLRLMPVLFLFLLPLGTVDDLETPIIGDTNVLNKDEETLHMLEPQQEMVEMKH